MLAKRRCLAAASAAVRRSRRCCGARPMEGRRYSLEAMSTGGFGAAGLVARGRSGTAAKARDAMEAGMCKDGLAGPEAECGR